MDELSWFREDVLTTGHGVWNGVGHCLRQYDFSFLLVIYIRLWEMLIELDMLFTLVLGLQSTASYHLVYSYYSSQTCGAL
jgi:hypothetical protein